MMPSLMTSRKSARRGTETPVENVILDESSSGLITKSGNAPSGNIYYQPNPNTDTNFTIEWQADIKAPVIVQPGDTISIISAAQPRLIVGTRLGFYWMGAKTVAKELNPPKPGWKQYSIKIEDLEKLTSSPDKPPILEPVAIGFVFDYRNMPSADTRFDRLAVTTSMFKQIVRKFPMFARPLQRFAI